MVQAVQWVERTRVPQIDPQVTTLLELVAAVADYAETDAEVVATVQRLINTGRVELIGAFRGADVRVG